MTNCIFCRIVSGQIPSKRVHEDADVVAFEDVNPAAPTHVLVVPRRHLATLDDASDDDAGLLGRLVVVARQIAAKRELGSGYRLVMNVHARWQTPDQDQACIAWARKFFETSKPFASGGAYVNFMTADEAERVPAAYGTNYQRLVRIKKQYDPQNIFRANQNIKA